MNLTISHSRSHYHRSGFQEYRILVLFALFYFLLFEGIHARAQETKLLISNGAIVHGGIERKAHRFGQAALTRFLRSLEAKSPLTTQYGEIGDQYLSADGEYSILFWPYAPPASVGHYTLYRELFLVASGINTRLVSSEAYAARISPNGKFLAYISADGKSSPETGRVLVVETLQGKVIAKVENAWSSLIWSPDSKFIALDCPLDEQQRIDEPHNKPKGKFPPGIWHRPPCNIWLYDIASDNLRQMTSGFENENLEAFHPTGDWLLLTSRRPIEGVWPFWRLDISSRKLTHIGPRTGSGYHRNVTTGGAWDNSGEQFAFSSYNKGGYEVYLLRLGSSDREVEVTRQCQGMFWEWSGMGSLRSMVFDDTQAPIHTPEDLGLSILDIKILDNNRRRDLIECKVAN